MENKNVNDTYAEEHLVSMRRTLRALSNRANDGDAQALGELRAILDSNPFIWERVGDLAGHAEQSLIDLIAGHDRLLVASLHRKLDALRLELTGDGPVSPIEKLAVERVIACWLQNNYLDLKAATTGGSRVNRNLWLRAQNQAHRRYLSAMKSLVTIRRLLPAHLRVVGRQKTG